MVQQRDPYQVLGIDRDAPPNEVKRAYKRLVLLHHPDRTGDPGSARQLRDVQLAYEALRPSPRRCAPPPSTPAPPAARDLFVELVLDPTEAAQGLTTTLRLPSATPCHACRGTGLDRFFPAPCAACHGRGAPDRIFEIAVPRGVADGARAVTPLPGAGNLVVVVRVRHHGRP